MLALEHLHANALLVVLLGGALAIVSLRAAVYLLHRSLVATDRKIMSSLRVREDARTQSPQERQRQSNRLNETYQDTPSRPDSKT
jgi:predicted Holliday junction resolvase-like endonuclease